MKVACGGLVRQVFSGLGWQEPGSFWGGEADVLPETLGQEHTKVHINVLPVVLGSHGVWGWCKKGVQLWVLWGYSVEGSATSMGSTCWAGADVQTRLGWHLLMCSR